MLSFLAWLSTQTVVVITANYLLYLFLKETLRKTEVLFFFFFQKTNHIFLSKYLMILLNINLEANKNCFLEKKEK